MDSKLSELVQNMGVLIDQGIKPMFKPGVKVAIIFTYEDAEAATGMVGDLEGPLLDRAFEFLKNPTKDGHVEIKGQVSDLQDDKPAAVRDEPVSHAPI